jgi:Flp pilus assembly protein protease CpaA
MMDRKTIIKNSFVMGIVLIAIFLATAYFSPWSGSVIVWGLRFIGLAGVFFIGYAAYRKFFRR